MVRVIQRFFGLGPCWHSLIKYYEVRRYSFGIVSRCRKCGRSRFVMKNIETN